MKLSPYLLFNGQCEDAFKFYERTLGAKILSMTRYEGSPVAKHAPANWSAKVLHARIDIGGQTVMGSDPPPDRYEAPKGYSISIEASAPAEAEGIFAALAEGGTVRMPIQETFWAMRFGMATDRFGTPWMVNCEKPA